MPALERLDQETAPGRELDTDEIQRQFNQMHRSMRVHIGHAGHLGGQIGHYKLWPVRPEPLLELLENLFLQPAAA